MSTVQTALLDNKEVNIVPWWTQRTSASKPLNKLIREYGIECRGALQSFFTRLQMSGLYRSDIQGLITQLCKRHRSGPITAQAGGAREGFTQAIYSCLTARSEYERHN